jgi:hypothetical protein
MSGTERSSGIIPDLARWVVGVLLNYGRGVQSKITTQGTNTDTKMLSESNFIIPAFTILNSGSSTIRVGWGKAEIPLVAGASWTVKWKNPVAGSLVYNDLGVSGIEIDVWG